MTDKVLYQQDGQIVTITLNDPAMRNPISERETVDAIVAAIERLNQDGTARVRDSDGCRNRVQFGGRFARDEGGVRCAGGTAFADVAVLQVWDTASFLWRSRSWMCRSSRP